MSFALVGIAAASGATKIGMALAGRKKRIQEQKSANAELKMRRDAYESLDTSNPYLNMENTMEDLTVNQQQAQFQKDMAQQVSDNKKLVTKWQRRNKNLQYNKKKDTVKCIQEVRKKIKQRHCSVCQCQDLKNLMKLDKEQLK